MKLYLLVTTILAVLDLSWGQCAPTVTTASGSHAPSELCSGNLIFEDNFDMLDMKKWQHEITLAGGGNWEFQGYTNNRSNSFTNNGRLYLRPSLLSDQTGEAFLTSGTLDVHGGAPADECTNPMFYGCTRMGTPTNIVNPIKSARLRTVNSFIGCTNKSPPFDKSWRHHFRYGRVEISAKMPAGDWLWPAIWMMPAYNAYGTWPSSGEIDIAESRGNRQLVIDGVNIGVQQVGSTLHYGPYPSLNMWDKAHGSLNNAEGFHNSFKKYQLEWTPDFLKFSIDGTVVKTVTPPSGGFWAYGDFNGAAPNTENPWRFGTKMAPFDQEFYIIMNLAVGGVGYFPDNASNPDDKPWNNNSPTAMKDFYDAKARWLATWGLDANDGADASLQVDYVRVWAL